MVAPALTQGGYHYRNGVNVGARLGTAGRKHVLDIFAWDDAFTTYLVSMKWQQVSGTAEQKVPYEVMCLADIIVLNQRAFPAVTCAHCGAAYQNIADAPLRAHLVLGGNGWTLRDFYTSGGLNAYMQHTNVVTISTLEAFVALANKGKL
jgi:PD-(D/E)XK nuclease superfamily domain